MIQKIKDMGRKIKLRLESKERIYKFLLPKNASDPGEGEITNSALKSEQEYRNAEDKLDKHNLVKHPDTPKNWDALNTVQIINAETDEAARILDAGGMTYSPVVDCLYQLGYRNLNVINPSFEKNFNRGPIKYIEGDATATEFPENHFDAISCLSVIEHGVDVEEFLEESFRILKDDGILVISTDYWQEKIDTGGKKAYGTEIRIFSEEEIKNIVSKAKKQGFETTGEIDYSVDEKTVDWKGFRYTFIMLTLRKT